MFDFARICNDVEKLTPAERGILIASQSVKVLKGLSALPETADSPVTVLTTFIIGAVVSDGKLNEKEYLLIYPSLVKAFGDNFDYESVKKAVSDGKEGRTFLNKCSAELMEYVKESDEDLQADIVTLCLLIVSVDGKINLKERRYVKNLCK